ncbi:leucine-rich repeat domain-containing protein [Streptomyces mirabilis]
MALSQSELIRLLESLRSAEGLELVRSIAERIRQELIEAEVTAKIGAEWNEYTEARTNYRNGHRDKTLSALREAHLMGNQLRTLPERLGGLTDLRELRLMDNEVTAPPPSIGELVRLRHLDLRNNQLGALPDAIGALTELTHLDLRNKRLTRLPDALALLPSLEKLDLRWNILDELPPWLDGLAHLGCVVLT